MKRLRIQRLTGQLLSSKSRPCCLQQQQQIQKGVAATRSLSTSTSDVVYEDADNRASEISQTDISQLPSPPSEAALSSAKLAAFHARLALPAKLPLQTLSRTLIDPSADSSKDFNNASMARLGTNLMSYHVTEWLMCTYPRLPMAILYSAVSAYIGPATLQKIATEWGVESAAYPGAEVDPGLLQFSKLQPGAPLSTGATNRPGHSYYRRGMSSRVVYDDEFGDTMTEQKIDNEKPTEVAYAGFVRALVGSIYLHAGSKAAKSFVTAHILSRHLPITQLFQLRKATRDLSRLCARENFDYPVARLLSETGRLSRHPVFIVGIFSGNEKLGEGAGPSLDEARTRAAVAALKAWYLYSPTAGKTGPVPSDVENGGKWEPVHVDIGEIV
jgi:dsRNA-specific ribonuclease